MRDFNHPANRRCWLGTSGIGKSTHFLKTLAKEKAPHIFIYDHKREFSTKMRVPICETMTQISAATASGGIVCYDYHREWGNDRRSGLNFFCKYVYSVSEDLKGRKIFIADEIQETCGPDDQPWDLVTLMDDGRSFKIDTMLIAQSPNGVHTDIRNQFTEVFVFRQADENAIKFLSQNGLDEKRIRNLRPGEWLWRNLNTGQIGYGGKAFIPDTKGTPDGCTLIKGNAATGSGE